MDKEMKYLTKYTEIADSPDLRPCELSTYSLLLEQYEIDCLQRFWKGEDISMDVERIIYKKGITYVILRAD